MSTGNKYSSKKSDVSRSVIKYAFAALLILPALVDQALASESNSLVQIIDPQIKSQLWINPGMASYHFQQDKNFNNGNWGAGLEYWFNTVASLTAGRFYNSDRDYSNYAGVYYQPIAIGPIKVGAVVGGFNGYPNTNNGGWFAAALPALTWEVIGQVRTSLWSRPLEIGYMERYRCS